MSLRTSRMLSPSDLGVASVRRQRTFTKEDFVKAKFIFRIFFLVAFIAILSIFYIWSRAQIVHTGYEINLLKGKQRGLVEENKRLRLEMATLGSPLRIEQVAREKLGMQSVQSAQVKNISTQHGDIVDIR